MDAASGWMEETVFASEAEALRHARASNPDLSPEQLRPAVKEYVSKGPSVPISTAHLVHTIGYNTVHAMRHLDEAHRVDKKPSDRMFDIEHAQNHVAEAQEHVIKLTQHLIKNYPAEGAEMKRLDAEADEIVPDNHAADITSDASDST